MFDSGKRARSLRDADNDSKNYKRRATDKDDKGNVDLIVYKILCPDTLIRSVIGKSGKVINSIRQDTQAKVKVVDPFPGVKFRVIAIYSYVREKVYVEVEDEFDDRKLLCAAQDALLRVHAAIASSLAAASDSDNKRRDKEECQILVPSSQSATIIGKGGNTIKKLRGKTRANIRGTSKDAADPTHSCVICARDQSYVEEM